MKSTFFVVLVGIIIAVLLVESDFKQVVLDNESIMPFVVVCTFGFELVIALFFFAWSKYLQRPNFYAKPNENVAPLLGGITSSFIYYTVIFQLFILLIVADTLGGSWEWLYWVLMGLIIIGAAIPVII